jgi:hypothetical protein
MPTNLPNLNMEDVKFTGIEKFEKIAYFTI